MTERNADKKNPKQRDLEAFREDGSKQYLTTSQGVRVQNDQDTLKAGARGPSLLEDFHFREKLTHFDHERIPERVVHARGAGAHGYFQVYEALAPLTTAAFLQDPGAKTPVFVRFSTVVGSRGSSDMARDVRGFAAKFYTEEGNFDLVGNNMPVFFIQDAMKFPDLVHAIKPEPHNEIPQASAAHDTFWDFISLTPESMHMILWVMSDRALPRSFRMMEGFGVHTFRMLNAAGESRFVKFHWKPLLGVHGMLWEEAQRISGTDPDFLRRDLWDAIENGEFPEWELGLQIVEAEDEHRFDFDLLDATKIIPEELVPVRRVGKLVLDRNPENFFAETEQVAFHVGNVVPGIDFTDDPLMQGRLFSYLDTQLIRLGGPNFAELPINRPIAPVHNNQRDGFMRQTINRGRVSYQPNTLGDNFPQQAKATDGGFVSFAERLEGVKLRLRGDKFRDHYSQASLFWNSQSEAEQLHIVQAFRFELGSVESEAVRARMLAQIARVDRALVERVGTGLGLNIPESLDLPLNMHIPAGADVSPYQPYAAPPVPERSGALSMEFTARDSVRTRKVAILTADGFDGVQLREMVGKLQKAGAAPKIVALHMGQVRGTGGAETQADYSLLTTVSAAFDALFVPGGAQSVEQLRRHPKAMAFIQEMYTQCKALAAADEGAELVREALRRAGEEEQALHSDGMVVAQKGEAADMAEAFIRAIARHRHWSRELDRSRKLESLLPR